MNPALERHCYDSRRREMRLLALAALVLLVTSALWHQVKGTVVYRVACSSIGCPDRLGLIADALRQRDPRFPDAVPRFWSLSWAKPEWIAWSSVRESVPLEDGSTLPNWKVTVADHNLTVRGFIAADRPFLLTPADRDGDSLCEVVMEIAATKDDAQQDHVWWVVLRLGTEHNEILWVGLMDESVWHSRGMRLKPIWRDEDGDGMGEFVFITVETTRTPAGGLVFKPLQTIAVFEWSAPGGILRTLSLASDSGITPWSPGGREPIRVDQTADLAPLVHELLPAPEVP